MGFNQKNGRNQWFTNLHFSHKDITCWLLFTLMLRLFIICIFLPLFVRAQVPGPKPDTYINDYTHSLTAAQIKTLDQELFQLEQQTTVQMAIVLIPDLPKDMSIEEYARTIGNTWKVGRAFNGLVYVAVLQEHRQRLEVGRNLEGEIPDITAFEIIESLKPYLGQEDYYGALALLIRQVNDRLGNGPTVNADPKGVAPQEQPIDSPATPGVLSDYEKEKAKWDHYGMYALWLLLAGAVGFSIWAWRYKRKYVREHTVNGVYTGIGSSYFASTYGSDSSDSGGGGSSGFGGFGGGGGGGFSGGGASGSW